MNGPFLYHIVPDPPLFGYPIKNYFSLGTPYTWGCTVYVSPGTIFSLSVTEITLVTHTMLCYTTVVTVI